ncbi:MAG: hypothetical protein QNJ30_17030 [Kiloniellales bacterium]|nr:hypothetical protein [Kiloniellales bacterium]
MKKNNREYRLLEVSPPPTCSHDSKFSCFFEKDILNSKPIQGILETSKRATTRPAAGMSPGGGMDRGGPARQCRRSNLMEIKTLTLILGDLVYRKTGAGLAGWP